MFKSDFIEFAELWPNNKYHNAFVALSKATSLHATTSERYITSGSPNQSNTHLLDDCLDQPNRRNLELHKALTLFDTRTLQGTHTPNNCSTHTCIAAMAPRTCRDLVLDTKCVICGKEEPEYDIQWCCNCLRPGHRQCIMTLERQGELTNVFCSTCLIPQGRRPTQNAVRGVAGQVEKMIFGSSKSQPCQEGPGSGVQGHSGGCGTSGGSHVGSVTN